MLTLSAVWEKMQKRACMLRLVSRQPEKVKYFFLKTGEILHCYQILGFDKKCCLTRFEGNVSSDPKTKMLTTEDNFLFRTFMCIHRGTGVVRKQ